MTAGADDGTSRDDRSSSHRPPDDRTQEMALPPRAENSSGAGSGATSLTAASTESGGRVQSEPARDSTVENSGPQTAVLPTIGDAHPWGTSSREPQLNPVTPPERSTAPVREQVTRVRLGAGLPGFLSVAALAGIGVGMFALPLAARTAPTTSTRCALRQHTSPRGTPRWRGTGSRPCGGATVRSSASAYSPFLSR